MWTVVAVVEAAVSGPEGLGGSARPPTTTGPILPEELARRDVLMIPISHDQTWVSL
jgi:hypothetical protein